MMNDQVETGAMLADIDEKDEALFILLEKNEKRKMKSREKGKEDEREVQRCEESHWEEWKIKTEIEEKTKEEKKGKNRVWQGNQLPYPRLQTDNSETS